MLTLFLRNVEVFIKGNKVFRLTYLKLMDWESSRMMSPRRPFISVVPCLVLVNTMWGSYWTCK